VAAFLHLVPLHIVDMYPENSSGRKRMAIELHWDKKEESFFN